MGDLHTMHYKETTPDETVNKLKSILDDMNIDVEECWSKESTIGTYSLRLRIKGTDIGSNGKGISREYARASAYAEFMERLQNDILISAYIRHGEAITDSEINMGREPDGKVMTSEEIINQGGAFLDFYFTKRNMQNASEKEKIEQFKSINKFEYMITGKDNEFYCIPFYSCKEKKIYYLPKHVYEKYYGSNGMAAGNRPAEALVQGYSEILERISQTRIFNEKPVLPIIPEEYIMKFDYIYEMYSKLKKDTNYRVELKDCSFGGKYPVAALVIKQINTGCYGIKLGCHPDYALALERAFTEAAQGNDVTEYVNRSVLDFKNGNVSNKVNIENSFKTGLAQYPYEIFMESDNKRFYEYQDIKGKTNEELFKKITKDFLDEGYDVLIRDVSNLGFPSYHMIVPGVSELKSGEDCDFRASNTRAFVTSLLMQPQLINRDNCRYITAAFGFYAQASMGNTLGSFYPQIEGIDFPGEAYHCGIAYLSAMCEAYMGNFERAEKYMEYVEKSAISTKQSDDEIKKMRAVRYYFSARTEFEDHDGAMNYLKYWFDSEYWNMLDGLFADIDKIFIKQYPDCSNWRENIYFEPQRISFNAVNALREKQRNMPVNQMNIGELL